MATAPPSTLSVLSCPSKWWLLLYSTCDSKWKCRFQWWRTNTLHLQMNWLDRKLCHRFQINAISFKMPTNDVFKKILFPLIYNSLLRHPWTMHVESYKEWCDSLKIQLNSTHFTFLTQFKNPCSHSLVCCRVFHFCVCFCQPDGFPCRHTWIIPNEYSYGQVISVTKIKNKS